ncbi:MAG: phasin family protein [Planctomycetia bacterium]|nr:phasin family protein [Planctomycetia bacterium]
MNADDVKNDLRRLMLAAAGAVGLAADEAKSLLDRMVKRGDVAEKDAKAVLEKIAASRPVAATKEAARKAGAAAGRGWDAVLSKLNMPSRAEMEELEKKVQKLSAKLRKLEKEGE